jgi:LAO/AO transport system kinase
MTSSAENKGIDDLWKLICEYRDIMVSKNEFFLKREQQMKMWFWTHLKENLLDIILSREEFKSELEKLERQVVQGLITPGQASDCLIDLFNKKHF